MIAASLPVLPVAIIYFSFSALFKQLSTSVKQRISKKRIKASQAALLRKKTADLDEFCNPKSHSYDTVTRFEVDNFLPNYNSELVAKFEYLDPDRSFCKIVKSQKINQNEGGTDTCRDNTERITDSPLCIICLEQFAVDADILVLPCDHCFHASCILRFKAASKKTETSKREKINFRCLLCHLNVLRHYLFYKNYSLNPDKIRFENKIVAPREAPSETMVPSICSRMKFWSSKSIDDDPTLEV
jgi:hypothetical protein